MSNRQLTIAIDAMGGENSPLKTLKGTEIFSNNNYSVKIILFGDSEIIKAIAKIQSQSTTNPSSISQAAAVEALNGNQDFIEKHNIAFKKRRDLVVEKLNSIDGISCGIPPGAFYVYPNCEGIIGRKTPDGIILDSDEKFMNYHIFGAIFIIAGITLSNKKILNA